MCPSNSPQKDHWHEFLTDLPKCEHHIHLEGCLTPSLIFHLSQKNSIPLPSPTTNPAYTSIESLSARYGHFTSLDDFLSFYFTGMTVLKTASDFSDLAFSYFARASSEGVHHAEVFFDPQDHMQRGIAYDTIVSGYVDGCKRAERELGVSTRLIMCFLKHLPVESAEALYKTSLEAGHLSKNPETGDSPIIHGLGCSSSEVGPPKDMFRSIYASASARGINLTAHAGEEGDSSYIETALSIGATRIDHGIALASDPALMARVAAEKILLTVCPVSNVQLKCVERISEVPIRTFLDHGVRFSINSDDPAYFGAWVLECYCRVQEAFGLSVDEWRVIAENSVEGSWVGVERKRELVGRIGEVVERFRGVLEG
ncbi:adenine deaminase [Aspergillus karnatakaensis]|uniref:adenosine deaminase n=1 Tax=Aspergillus karnatakaensis TaxID=1810916 RepID=UPI003CCD7BA7